MDGETGTQADRESGAHTEGEAGAPADGERIAVHRGRRRVALVIVLSAVFVVVYAGVVLLYSVGGVGTSAAQPVPSGQGVHVVLTPRSVDTSSGEIAVQAEFDPSSIVVAESGLTMETRTDLLIVSERGQSLTSYAVDQPVAATSVQLGTNGEVEAWPFDHYTTELVAVAYRVPDSGGGKATVPMVTDVSLGAHHVSGWRFSISKQKTWSLETDTTPVPVTSYVITATRATSTVAFGLLLLALMIVMPIVALVVAVLTVRGRRPFHPSFLSWIAAMLFATPALRGLLPGQPPIGSWVDYLIVLWVVVTLIIALVIAVVAWNRWSAQQPR